MLDSPDLGYCAVNIVCDYWETLIVKYRNYCCVMITLMWKQKYVCVVYFKVMMQLSVKLTARSQMIWMTPDCLLYRYVHLHDHNRFPDCVQNFVPRTLTNSRQKLLMLNCHWRHSVLHREPSLRWVWDVTTFHIRSRHLFHCLIVTTCLVSCSTVLTPSSAGWPTVQRSVLLRNSSRRYKIWLNGMKDIIDYTVSQKKEATKLWAVTLSNLNRF